MEQTQPSRARHVLPAPDAGQDRSAGARRGAWSGKPVGRLTTDELAEALQFLERHPRFDDALARALAGEFARRTAARLNTGRP